MIFIIVHEIIIMYILTNQVSSVELRNTIEKQTFSSNEINSYDPGDIKVKDKVYANNKILSNKEKYLMNNKEGSISVTM